MDRSELLQPNHAAPAQLRDTATGAQSANQFDLIKRYAARIRALPENGGPRDVWNPAEQRDTAHGETP